MPAECVDALSQLAQPPEVEEVRSGGGRKGGRGVRSAIGRAEGHGGMAAIGQTDDDVGPLTAADADDGELLPAERVMGMRDGHASRRRLGRRGSALGMCQPSAIAWCRWLPC